MSACRHCGRTGRSYRDEPTGYVAWHEWAEKMSRTHEQHPCPGCGRLSIWRKRADSQPEQLSDDDMCEHGYVREDAAHPSAGLEHCPVCDTPAAVGAGERETQP